MTHKREIRNFCIIAHIDHGKSTLADRFLEVTGTLSGREMVHDQMLDTMDIEQERGITIKLQPAKMFWKGCYLNLIDTPGHVDFSYEVSRSLKACEGAILVVDSTQGIQAQTLANVYQAIDNNLKIIPVLNKIDLPNSNVPAMREELRTVFGFTDDEILCCSAKTGEGVADILDMIIDKIPEPKVDSSQETKALIFDAVYDSYRGVLAYVRVFSGGIKAGDKVYFVGTKSYGEALEVGFFMPKLIRSSKLETGDIGYVVTGLKDLKNVRVGDTITVYNSDKNLSSIVPLAGYKKVEPVVFASMFCVDNTDYAFLRKSLEKLSLNDSSLYFEPKHSDALGFGFHCGFLGLLHLEIVQERLEREFNLDLVMTSPTVSYEVIYRNGVKKYISNPSEMPEPTEYSEVREPWVKAELVLPEAYIGSVMKLSEERRGVFIKMEYMDKTRVIMEYELPLASIILDFYDRLKSISSGYASFSYVIYDYRPADLIKMDILIASEKVDALSIIVLRSEAMDVGREVLKKLKDVIPRHLFKVSLQAAVSGKIISREDISAVSKNVTENLYGGDVTRKNKLRKKQAKGKKRMKQFGKVNVPKDAFLNVLKRD